MNKIKILHVTFNMAIGGTEQVIRQLVESTDRSLYIPSVVCLDNHIGELGIELQKKGYVVHKLKRKASGLDITLIRQLHHYIQDNRFNILHCHQYTPYTYGLLASCYTNATVIFTEHGRFYPESYKWKRVLINRLLSLYTHSIISISKSTAESLIKYENFPRKKINVIYNGIKDTRLCFRLDTNLKYKLNLTNGSPVLGTISRLDPIKNQQMMIQSFKMVLTKYPKAKLIIVGDGPIRADLENLVSQLDIDDKVIFTGFSVNPQQYLNSIDIFLLSSFSEGTSMTLLEAMAFSKPCVVTDVGGNPEIVLDGVTGYISPSDDPKAFAARIIDILDNKELRQQMERSTRTRFESSFTVENMVSSYEELYASSIQ